MGQQPIEKKQKSRSFAQGKNNRGEKLGNGRRQGVRTSRFQYLYLPTPALFRPASVPCNQQEIKTHPSHYLRKS